MPAALVAVLAAGSAAFVPADAGSVPLALLELDGVVPLALDDDLGLLLALPGLPAFVVCADWVWVVEEAVLAPASVVSPSLPGLVLSSPHAPAATIASAAKPKRKVDFFMFISCRVEQRMSVCAVISALRRDASHWPRYAEDLGHA